MQFDDVIIIGAGASGLMCAIEAGRRGRRVRVIDHAKQAGNKIRISGGGHCNFTNRGITAAQYVSQNPHFCKSALSRYPSEKFVELVESHKIAFEERKLGKLFCLGSARDLVTMLEAECRDAEVHFDLDCKVLRVAAWEGQSEGGSRFEIETSKGIFRCESLVIATGGLSIPKVGATGLGYEIARQFGLKVLDTVPALDGFRFENEETRPLCALAGIALECVVTCNPGGKKISFRENILFTHSGLSGPASLQASLYWNPGDEIWIDLLPGVDVYGRLLQEKKKGGRGMVKNLVGEFLPGRLVEYLCERYFPSQLPLPQVSEKALEGFCQLLHEWRIIPSGTVGYSKAEVTRGGVDTDELSSKTMESKKVPGLYFIGEVVDVTGWLGGYNLHWAWASGHAAGQSV